ncbi:hypothetical protein PFISCL1PPCAC_4856, partial [Pristionchus fissidentatus]
AALETGADLSCYAVCNCKHFNDLFSAALEPVDDTVDGQEEEEYSKEDEQDRGGAAADADKVDHGLVLRLALLLARAGEAAEDTGCNEEEDEKKDADD